MKYLIYFFLLSLVSCKGYYETKLVTKQACETKFPSIPCPPPLIIDESFKIDSLIKITGIQKETIFALSKKFDTLTTVYDDSLMTIKFKLDSASSTVKIQTLYKDRVIPIETGNIKKLIAQIAIEKTRGDSLYKEVYYWKQEFNKLNVKKEKKPNLTINYIFLGLGLVLILFVILKQMRII